MDAEKWIGVCLEMGACKAGLIPVEKIPFDKGLRRYCEENLCGSYNKNYACPPCVGTPDKVIEKAKQYQNALVFQTVSQLEDSFDVEGMAAAGVHHEEVSEKIFAEVAEHVNSYLLLTAGGCRICKTCAKAENKPCRFPEKAVSSLEAYCINVVKLAPLCGMKYVNGANTVTYFSAFLFS